jgi:tRNA 2-thiouridine synthesizing protein E|tara:strand:- start:252 stop:572 length:321 start_codon:yes stop_codon:yes gene_type:complete
VNELKIALDKEGFVADLNTWNENVAALLASNEKIELTTEHWDVITALRDFYNEYQLSPAMRPLVKYLKLQLDKPDLNSIYLLNLFPGSPAKIAAKIAGLPKPENCL